MFGGPAGGCHVLHDDFNQTGTAVKYADTHTGNTGGNHHTFQFTAAHKRIDADGCHSSRNRHTGQLAAFVKRAVSYIR